MDPQQSGNEATGRNQAIEAPASQAWRVCDLPERLRPREEVDRLGIRNVSDDVLLAVLLRGGVRGVSVVELARRLLHDYGSLTALSQTSVEELRHKKVPGLGRVKAQVLLAALELGRRMSEESAGDRFYVRSPADAAKLLHEDAVRLEQENFWVVILDKKNRVKRRPVRISEGLLDASLVHPREVFKEAVRCSAGAVVLVHNHPSGDPTPSAEDIRITRQLVEAGRIMDVPVLDHVVLGRSHADGPAFVSLREAGLVSFVN